MARGIKHDTDKDRWDLLPVNAARAIVRVLTFGARKYDPENWRRVPDAKRRYYAAALRHMTSWWEGEKLDPESTTSHTRGVAWSSRWPSSSRRMRRMQITVNGLEAELPYDGATHVVVRGKCPGCGCEPFHAQGHADIERGHDTYSCSSSCGCGHPSGRMVVTFSTLFGLEEDERVLNGRARVY